MKPRHNAGADLPGGAAFILATLYVGFFVMVGLGGLLLIAAGILSLIGGL